MNSEARVSPDPFMEAKGTERSCFACNVRNERTPSLPVHLTVSQISKRSSVDTGGVPNPFLTLLQNSETTVNLCSYCRDKNSGWNMICASRKYPRLSRKSLATGKTRYLPKIDRAERQTCEICSRAGLEGTENVRNHSRYWKLFNIQLCSVEVQTEFINELCRLSKCMRETSEDILQNPGKFYHCYNHINHIRLSKLRARRFELSQAGTSKCIFYRRGCPIGD